MSRTIICARCKTVRMVTDADACTGWIQCPHCMYRERVADAIRRSDSE